MYLSITIYTHTYIYLKKGLKLCFKQQTIKNLYKIVI